MPPCPGPRKRALSQPQCAAPPEGQRLIPATVARHSAQAQWCTPERVLCVGVCPSCFLLRRLQLGRGVDSLPPCPGQRKRALPQPQCAAPLAGQGLILFPQLPLAFLSPFSRLPPSFLSPSSRLPRGFLPVSSRLPLAFLSASSQLPPAFLSASSQLPLRFLSASLSALTGKRCETRPGLL